jgi:hypothetical protein
LDEVLEDPIVNLLMARDGWSPDDVRSHVEAARRRMCPRSDRRRDPDIGAP